MSLAHGMARLRHHHHDAVDSTMEAARAAAAELSKSSPGDFLLVTAERQTAGRGTRGRPWHSPPGNIYMTLAIPRQLLPPARLQLFPMDAGLALWEAASHLLPPESGSRLRLKWPNDLLWESRKAAGMLLEAATDHIFVGVGVNIAEAPEVTDGGTPSGRLADAGIGDGWGLELALSFGGILRDRLSAPSEMDAGDTLARWRAAAEWDRPLRLRDRAGRPEVTPVDVNAEGHLCVRFADGHEEWLIAEYLA
jgi:BirA family biotin operon repressor/biotin-[acetyl-CoA-carboxylase] ligase